MITLVFCCLVCLACSDVGEIPEQPAELDWTSHQWASWSPNGGDIAFTAHIDGLTGIYLIDTSGQDLRVVIAAPASGGTTWSPDGQWIASSWHGNLFKAKPTGDSLTFLTNSGQDFFPAWAPNSAAIAYSKTICDPECGIFLVSPDGTGERLLHMFGLYPSWFSTSERLVFLRSDRSPQGHYTGYSFWEINVDTPAASILYAVQTSDFSNNVAVNQADDVIAYTRRTPGRYSQVWSLNLVTGAHKQLTFDGGSMPAWRADGMMFVYTRTHEGDGGLWIMNSDGTGRRRLTQPIH